MPTLRLYQAGVKQKLLTTPGRMLSMTETTIMRDILVRVTTLPDTVMWRNQAGVFVTRDGRAITIGLPGSPELVGVHRGRAVGIEVKTERGRQSQVQRRFQSVWERAGGIYIVARSADQAIRGLVGP